MPLLCKFYVEIILNYLPFFSSQLGYESLIENLACSLNVIFNMIDFFFVPEEKLAADRMMVKFSPKDPGVDEDVTFSVHLNYSTVSINRLLHRKCEVRIFIHKLQNFAKQTSEHSE